MVDALRRAHRLLRSGGLLFDIHPVVAPVDVEVGADRERVIVGTLDDADARPRHMAAEVAIRAAVQEGVFAIDGSRDCSFRRTAPSLEELTDYVARKWTGARIDEATVARVRFALRDKPGAPVSVREDARVTRFRPL